MSGSLDFLKNFLKAPFDFGNKERGDLVQIITALINISLGVLLIIYLYLDNWSDKLIYDGTNDFAIYVMTGRATLFILSLVFALSGLFQIFAKVLGKDDNSFLATVNSALNNFQEKFMKYLGNFLHTALSLLLVTVGFLYTEEENRQDGAEGKFALLWIAGGVATWYKVALDIMGFEAKKGEKHAVTPAIIITIALILYVIETGDSEVFWERMFNKGVALVLLVAYLVLAAIDKAYSSENEEWTILDLPIGLMSLLSYPLLIYTGVYLGLEKSREAVVFALGVIVIDSMRIGRLENVSNVKTLDGTSEQDVQVWDPKISSLYRLFNGVAGVLAFAFITVTSPSGEAATVEPLLYGVALVSALVKIMSVFFIGKEMRMPSTEQNFRSLSSAALLVVSAYLWAGGTWFTDANVEKGWSVTFFIVALVLRFLDSLTTSAFVFVQGGANWMKAVMAFIQGSYYGDEPRDSVHQPTYDNPRVWLVLLALVSSLAFQAAIITDEWDVSKVGSNTTEMMKFADAGDTLVTHNWAAVALISVHIVVVIAALVRWKMLALSTMPIVRYTVSTAVISCIVVVAGQLRFGSMKALATPNSPEQKVVSGLISYILADALGDGLL